MAFYKEMIRTLADEGRWQGEIYTRNKNGGSGLDWLTVNVVRDDHGEVIQHVAVFSDVNIVKRSLEKLDHLAHHDILTGLPNRLLLRGRLDHAMRRVWRERRGLAVIYLDLDRFKNINDTLGHTAGDELLRIVATRLSDQVRDGDTVARLGGDEFMILLEDCRSPHDARSVAQKVLDSFRAPFLVKDQELFVTASIGISTYPGDGVTVDELISNSDAAMYRAKEQGKDNYQFYTTDLTIAAREKLQLESSLRLALERNEFELHYQPKWNTSTGAITGIEALLRWRHPVHGLVEPLAFLAALEDCGLILPIGRWILRTACRQMQTWRQRGLPAIQMSINISGRQLAQGDLLKVVEESLAESGLDPHYLELEITEGFLMKQPDQAIALLQAFRDWGVSIAIDDFGTGYSSLSYLKQLPIQKLKIDRSFVRDIPENSDDVAITSAIIALGLRLQMLIVAEGVETAEQLEFLKREGCGEAQGYLFSKPLPPAEATALLQRSYAIANLGITTANS
jgi:diguanylate cyclase (GGDEF)-like protein